jgi:hypothetical protein
MGLPLKHLSSWPEPKGGKSKVYGMNFSYACNPRNHYKCVKGYFEVPLQSSSTFKSRMATQCEWHLHNEAILVF